MSECPVECGHSHVRRNDLPMPAEPQSHALHHLALGARDVERVAGFYAKAFELPEVRRHLDEFGKLRSIWLQLGTAILMIEHTTRARPVVDGVDAGFFLLALRVDTSDRARLERRLMELGHPVESRTEHSSYFRDPEGNRFAISQYPVD